MQDALAASLFVMGGNIVSNIIDAAFMEARHKLVEEFKRVKETNDER